MKKIICYLILVAFASSCRKADELSGISNSPAPAITNENVVLGKKLENPYSVANMRKAYQRLKGNNSKAISTSEESLISTSHYYVRFLPVDTAQNNALKADTSLKLYQIPLDYEVISAGCDVQDTSEIYKPQWFYTSVPANFQFSSGIKYEIIENLFIPELVPVTTTSALSTSAAKPKENFALKLVNEAMKITNNFQDTVNLSDGNKVKFTATGRVRVFDDRLNNWVPLEGVRIRCRRWFNIKNTTTDSQGNYRI